MLPTNAITSPAPNDRADQDVVRQVAGAEPRVVGREHVAFRSVSTGKRASRRFAVIGSTTQKFGGLQVD